MRIALTLAIIIVVFVGVTLLPVRETAAPPFAHPAFHQVWNAESAEAAGGIDLWGSEPLMWRMEPYVGAPNDRRTVQYFERGRMEAAAGSSEVTQGLLVQELTSGQIVHGETVQDEREPPEIPIDGGEQHEQVPTYRTLSQLVDKEAENRSDQHQRVTAWVDAHGPVDHESTPSLIQMGDYVEETGHNLPIVTVELFHEPAFADNRWVETFGYPISEPVWTYYRRNGTLQPSLIQVFQRRILVYSPQLEREQQFTVANSGRHYYRWRYESELTPEKPPFSEELPTANLNLPEGYQALVYAEDIGTPVDMALAPSGHPLVLTLDGTVLRASNADPDAHPTGFIPWLDGIVDPQGIVTENGVVYVSSADGIRAFREIDGRAVEQVAGSAATSGEALVPSLAASPSEVPPGVGGDADSRAAISGLQPARLLAPLDRFVDNIGSLIDTGDDILATVVDAGRPALVRLPSLDGNIGRSDLESIVEFEQGTTVHTILPIDGEVTDMDELGELFVAVERDGEGSLLTLSRYRSNDSTELVEFSNELDRPVAATFGLDGSLYVADSVRGQVLRIVPTS